MFTLLPIVGLVGSNNLSTAIIILGIGAILIFASSPHYLQFIALGGAGIYRHFSCCRKLPSGAPCDLAGSWKNMKKASRRSRTLRNRKRRAFGRGLGNSIQKLGFVPEAQNDMIYSIICEELGLTGAILLILVFGLLLWRLCVISMHSTDLFRCASLPGSWDIWRSRSS